MQLPDEIPAFQIANKPAWTSCSTVMLIIESIILLFNGVDLQNA